MARLDADRRWIRDYFDVRHEPGLATARIQFVWSRSQIEGLVSKIRRQQGRGPERERAVQARYACLTRRPPAA